MGTTYILTLTALVSVSVGPLAQAVLPSSCQWSYPIRSNLECTKLLPDFSTFDPFELHFASSLKLQNCQYTNIPANTFANLSSSLVSLSIDCNNVVVEPGTFAGLNLLQSVDLSNGLLQLPAGELCNDLPSLVSVDLSDNSLTTAADFGLTSSDPSCGSNWTTLKFSNNSLKVLSASGFLGNLLNLGVLNASYNSIGLIVPGAFANLTKLRKLYLDHNSLLLIDKTTFNGVPSLEILDLSYNQLFSISPLLFKSLTKLTDLNLRGNYIVMLHAGVFNDLLSLNTLDLRNNALNTLSTALRPLTKLSTLLLGNNFLPGVTFRSLGNLALLHHLDLDNNSLTFVDKESFLTTRFLTVLSLNNNKLTYLPTFAFTPVLLALYAANNSIAKLDPKQFKSASHLLFLDLSGNALTEINNSTFNNLTTLLKIDLSHNNISSIQNSSFANATSLKFVFLQNNNLTFEENVNENGTIDLFLPLHNLLFLNLSTNALNRFSYEWFPSSLVYLSLSNNNISALPIYNRTLDPLPSVHTLDLSSNTITSLSVNQFPPSVINVILSSNFIQSVSPKSFSSLSNLEYLFLRNNVLATLPQMTIPSALTTLTLRDNPWMCDCKLAWLKDTYNLPFVVYDIMALKCNFMLNKTQQAPSYFLTTSVDKFLCTFQQDGEDTSQCVTSASEDGANNVACVYQCPAKCTCYHDITWKIVQVDCSNTGLTTTPTGVPDVVQTLYLDGNELSTISDTSFVNMPVLAQIWLNSSKIMTVGDGAFTTTFKLETLNLGDNMIKTLSIKVFDNLRNLTKLDLSFNHLSDLDDEVFAPLTNLQVLNLQGNRLKTFPVWSFNALPQIKRLSLSDNPWSCECTYAQQFRDWLQDSIESVVNVKTLQCALVDAFGERRVSLTVFNASHCGPPTGITTPMLGAPASPESGGSAGAVLIATLMTISIVVLVLGVLAFVYRNELKFSFEKKFGIRLVEMGD